MDGSLGRACVEDNSLKRDELLKVFCRRSCVDGGSQGEYNGAAEDQYADEGEEESRELEGGKVSQAKTSNAAKKEDLKEDPANV